MHTLNKQSQNRRSGGRHSSPTKAVYVFRCGESGLYAFTADPKGHTLPSRIYPRIRWLHVRRVTLRLDKNPSKGEIVRATLDAIKTHGFWLTHAAANAELLQMCGLIHTRAVSVSPGTKGS
jgi:hypothetical protein